MKFPLVVLMVVGGLALSGCRRKPEAPAPTPQPAPTAEAVVAPAQGGTAPARAAVVPVAEKSPDLTALNAAYKKFWKERQSPPARLEDLVTQHYLTSLPVPPKGQKFNVDWSRMEVTLVNQ